MGLHYSCEKAPLIGDWGKIGIFVFGGGGGGGNRLLKMTRYNKRKKFDWKKPAGRWVYYTTVLFRLIAPLTLVKVFSTKQIVIIVNTTKVFLSFLIVHKRGYIFPPFLILTVCNVGYYERTHLQEI